MDVLDDDDDDDDDEDNEDKPIKPEVVREYISRARQHVPSVPSEVAPYIVEAYVTLRGQDQNICSDRTGGSSSNSDQTVMTARQVRQSEERSDENCTRSYFCTRSAVS